MLLHPSFPDDEIEKLRIERLAELKRREDNLSHKAFELFQHELFQGHPYAFKPLGTPETIQKISRDTLTNYYEEYARPSNGVLSVVGNVEPDAIVRTLVTKLQGFEAGDAVSLPARQAIQQPQQAREAFLEKGRAQVHIVMGFPGLRIDDPDIPALDALVQILSGQGGRLFLELRDKKSLAYSVTAFSIEGIDAGAFGLYIASAPDKLDESVEGLNEQLRRLLNEAVTAEELDRAKGYLIGSHAVSLQRLSMQASLLSLNELYGLGADYHLGFEKRIEAVTIDDISRVAERLIQPDYPLVAIVR